MGQRPSCCIWQWPTHWIGVHGGFLRQVTGKMTRGQWYRTWRRAAEDSVLKELGNQKLGTYIDKQQTTVAKWLALRPIYEVRDRDTGYE